MSGNIVSTFFMHKPGKMAAWAAWIHFCSECEKQCDNINANNCRMTLYKKLHVDKLTARNILSLYLWLGKIQQNSTGAEWNWHLRLVLQLDLIYSSRKRLPIIYYHRMQHATKYSHLARAIQEVRPPPVSMATCVLRWHKEDLSHKRTTFVSCLLFKPSEIIKLQHSGLSTRHPGQMPEPPCWLVSAWRLYCEPQPDFWTPHPNSTLWVELSHSLGQHLLPNPEQTFNPFWLRAMATDLELLILIPAASLSAAMPWPFS